MLHVLTELAVLSNALLSIATNMMLIRACRQEAGVKQRMLGIFVPSIFLLPRSKKQAITRTNHLSILPWQFLLISSKTLPYP